MAVQNMSPWQHLAATSKLYPDAWSQVEDFRKARVLGEPGMAWPDWCFLPMAAWYAMVSADAGVDRLPFHLIADVAKLAAIGTWRYSQGIYRFDESVYTELIATPLTKELPCEVLYRLPEWSLYIETPKRTFGGEKLYGFWAHLEYDMNDKRAELRLLLDTESVLLPVPLHLGDWTLSEAVDRAIKEARWQAAVTNIALPESALTQETQDLLAGEYEGLVSLLLYLCAEDPDVSDELKKGARPGRPTPTKTKKGWRLFPAQKPRIWTVGREVGEQLREYEQQGDSGLHGGMKPHLRRAHWHGFWRGPRNGVRKFVYKWLHPILVRGREEEDEREDQSA